MDFLVGCNYWASNAGTEMWREFDVEAIRKDMQTLSEHGVKCIRAFPIWRDFQPVTPVLKAERLALQYDKVSKVCYNSVNL